jgi:hypothetical protein
MKYKELQIKEKQYIKRVRDSLIEIEEQKKVR